MRLEGAEALGIWASAWRRTKTARVQPDSYQDQQCSAAAGRAARRSWPSLGEARHRSIHVLESRRSPRLDRAPRAGEIHGGLRMGRSFEAARLPGPAAERCGRTAQVWGLLRGWIATLDRAGPIFSGDAGADPVSQVRHATLTVKAVWLLSVLRSTISWQAQAHRPLRPPRQADQPGFGGHEVNLLGGGELAGADRSLFRFPGFHSSSTHIHHQSSPLRMAARAAGHGMKRMPLNRFAALGLGGAAGPAGEGSEEEGRAGLSFGSGGSGPFGPGLARCSFLYRGRWRMAPVTICPSRHRQTCPDPSQPAAGGG